MSDRAITYLTTFLAVGLGFALSGFLESFWLRMVAVVLFGMAATAITQTILKRRRDRDTDVAR